MGIFDTYNIFPILRTQRIIVDSEKVTIRALLSTKESKEHASTWLGTSRFTQYVKVCFAVVPKYLLTDVEKVYSSSSRFGLHAPCDGCPPNSFSRFQSEYATATMTLDEILQNDYASSVGASDLEGGMQINDLYFEIAVDMNQEMTSEVSYSFAHGDNISWNVTDNRRAASFDEWYVIGFLHFDYESFQENYSPVTNLHMLGGNCTVDKILERTTDFRGHGQVQVPRTIKTFLFAETWPEGSMHNSEIPVEHQVGELYFGISHFHDENTVHESLIFDEELNRYIQDPNAENVAPGYVGYMGGHPQDPGRGPKLDVIEIPNTKVIATQILRPQTEQWDGSSRWFHESYDENSPVPRMNQFTETSIREQMTKHTHLLGDVAKKSLNNIRRQIAYKNKAANSNVLFRTTASAIRVVRSGNLVLDSSCHQILCFASFEDILAFHSPLGWLVEYHLHNLRDEDDESTPDIIVDFINKSKILKADFFRKRMSNHPEGNVNSASPDYVTYDNDEIPKFLVTTSDQVYAAPHVPPRLIPAENPGIASISREICGDKSLRGFYLEDYDLFHNVTYGNYEYSAEFHIVDGIKTVLESRLASYYHARTEMTKYLNYMNTPCTFGKSETVNDYPSLSGLYNPEEETTQEVISGRLNWKTNRYVTSRETRNMWRGTVTSQVDAFIDVYKILVNDPFGEPAGTTWEDYRENIVSTLLDPHVGWLEYIVNFQDDIVLELEGILERGNISKYERITSGVLTPFLDASKEQRIINIKAKIPELVKAFSPTHIFYEPDLGDLGI